MESPFLKWRRILYLVIHVNAVDFLIFQPQVGHNGEGAGAIIDIVNHYKTPPLPNCSLSAAVFSLRRFCALKLTITLKDVVDQHGSPLAAPFGGDPFFI